MPSLLLHLAVVVIARMATVGAGIDPGATAVPAVSLMTHIRQSSDPLQIPAVYRDQPVKVTVGVDVTSLRELDMARNEMELSAMIYYEWNSTITWNETMSPVQQVTVPSNLMWTPDMTVFNAVGPLDNFAPDFLALHNSGNVFWVQRLNVRALCSMERSEATQNCLVKIGSWTRSGFDVTLAVRSENVLNDYVTNPQYDVLNATLTKHVTYYICCPEPFETINLAMTFGRRSKGFLSGWM